MGALGDAARKRARPAIVKGGKRPPAYADAATDNEVGWRNGLVYNVKDKALKATTGNAALLLTHSPGWKGVVGYDEMHERPVFLEQPPRLPGFQAASPGPIEDHHTAMISQHLLIEGGMATCSDYMTISAVYTAARQRPFHPVRNYLDDLEWDGEHRVDDWLVKYLGAADTLLHREVGKRWVISAVARIYQPGCKADHMLVLEGGQGVGKSSALATMAVRDEWFRDSLESLDKKDARIALRGSWIIEMAELDAMNRSEHSAAKAFLSTKTDRYRLPYGRLEQEVPRRCVFAGSTNDHQWLRDGTGNRRYWPVEIPGRIDIQRLAADRDQIWAEAVALFRRGEFWHIEDEDVVAAATEAQDERTVADPWEDTIADFLPALLAQAGETGVTTAAILARLGVEGERQTKRDQMRVGAVLARLGWRKTRSYGRQRYWVEIGN